MDCGPVSAAKSERGNLTKRGRHWFLPGTKIPTWLPTCPTTFHPNFLNVLTACLPEIFASLAIFILYTETTIASCFE